MCSSASGLFCACLFFSCVVHHCRCTNKQEHHHHHHSTNGQEEHQANASFTAEEKEVHFLHELFEIYGHNGVLNTKEFEAMLESFYFMNCSYLQSCHSSFITEKKSYNSIKLTETSNPSSSESQSSVQSAVEKSANGASYHPASIMSSAEEKISSSSVSDVESTASLVLKSKCFTPHELLQTHNISVHDDVITPSDFHRMCPAIVYYIHHSLCFKDDSYHSNKVDFDYQDSGLKIWLYASLSVIAISLCGLLSVAVIPLIQKLCYHALHQFLVALAVGSLSGDALLHLLPHSMVTEGHSHDDRASNGHNNTFIWHGLTALLGIYLFFTTERLLNHITSYRKVKRRSKVLQLPKFARSLTSVGEQSRVVGEKLSHHKHGSYGYRFDPELQEKVDGLERESLNENVLMEKEKVCAKEKSETPHTCVEDEKEGSLHIDINETKIVPPGCYPDDSSSKSLDIKEMEKHEECALPLKPLHVDVTYIPTEKHQPETPTEECHRETVVYRHAHDDHSYVVVTDHHAHHNHHGHSHELPTSTVNSVAWMVVMGDGLHNFCDGLAIGAAFGSGVAGGISTSVAVLCHELPHELGDFAMLLKAGMSVKQAMLFNSISSVLCFIGTLIGVSLGNIPSFSVTNWIFAGAAGMFLYIAFVDMLPELSATSGHSSTNACQQFLIQFLGIATGTSIMLFIALYEHELQHLVS